MRENTVRIAIVAALLALAGAGSAAALELPGGAELTIVDGRAEMAEIDLAAANDLRVTVTPPAPGTMLRWGVRCMDLKGEERWLELRLTARPRLTGALHYWPGFQPLELTEPFTELRTGMPQLPLAALWDDAGGMAIGLDPHERVSYIAHTADPSEPSFTLHVRIVLDPGASKSLTFVGFPVGRWGYLEALDRWYDLAPEFYEVRTEVDPRINRCSAQYAAWPPGGPRWQELCRRTFASWEWCYAPFKRTGDIVGRPEFWDYEMEPGREDVKQRMRLDDIEAFHQWRREVFAAGERGGVAMLFYVPAMVWAEEALAREHFADALTTDPQARTRIELWVTGWDHDLRVMPWNTSYGEQTKRDLAEVAAELDLTGFAFDTASGTARYSGPQVGEFEERAWDETVGVFVREGIGVANVIDYCHGLRNSAGRPLGVISNLGFAWYTVYQASDAGMREAAPWANERAYNDVARYGMGRKPICWWEGYEPHNLLSYEQMTPDELADAYIGLSDFVLNESYRWGYLPPLGFTRAITSAVAQLPTLLDCVHAGWEPVPAAIAEGASWVARYGDGLETRLVLGNETAEPAVSAVEVDAGYLGESALLFSGHDGAALTNQVLASGDTRIEGIAHEARRVAVLRCRARAVPAPAGCAATVAVTDDLASRVVDLRFEPPLTAGALVEVAKPAGYYPAGLQLDEGPIDRAGGGGAVRVRAPEGGLARLRVYFASETFAATRARLHDFPFAPEDGAPATILLRDGAAEAERMAAERLAEALSAYFACALDEPREVTLAVATGTAVRVAGAVVVIDGSGGAFAREFGSGMPQTATLPHVGVADRTLTVAAETPAGALAATEALLRVLDERYPWPGYEQALVANTTVGVLGQYVGADGRFHGTPPEGLP